MLRNAWRNVLDNLKEYTTIKRNLGSGPIWTGEDEDLSASQRQGRLIGRLYDALHEAMGRHQAVIRENNELVVVSNRLHEKLDEANAELLGYRLAEKSVCSTCGKEKVARTAATPHVCDCNE